MFNEHRFQHEKAISVIQNMNLSGTHSINTGRASSLILYARYEQENLNSVQIFLIFELTILENSLPLTALFHMGYNYNFLCWKGIAKSLIILLFFGDFGETRMKVRFSRTFDVPRR